MKQLVLIHGASGNAGTWGDLVDRFGEGTLALDLPGRGATPGPPRERVAALARWLVAELYARGVDEPVLLGHSLGGAVAIQAALDEPSAVSGLVLVSSSARLKVSPVILEAVAASSEGSPYLLDAAFGPETAGEVVAAYGQATARTPPAASVADWTACDHFDVRDRLAELRCPALVVWGDADFLTPPKHQRRLAEAVGASAVELPGVGHMLPWEDPEGLVEAVEPWLWGLDPAA